MEERRAENLNDEEIGESFEQRQGLLLSTAQERPEESK